MTYDPAIHHRRSIRLKNYDYSQGGAYFVTICTDHHHCLLGEIVNNEMALNDLGRIMAEEWIRTPTLRSNVELDQFVIMPNHFHAIILVHDTSVVQCLYPASVGNNTLPAKIDQSGTHQMRARVAAPLRRQSGSLGSIVAGFKSATTKRVNTLHHHPGRPLWQRNYYERIIRNENELSRAREYIANNPLKWDLDEENPVNCR